MSADRSSDDPNTLGGLAATEDRILSHLFNPRSALRSRETSPSRRTPLRPIFGIKKLGNLGRRDVEEGESELQKAEISAPKDARIIGHAITDQSLRPTPAGSGSPEESATPNSPMSPKFPPSRARSKSPAVEDSSSGPGSPNLSGVRTPPTSVPPRTGRSIRFGDETERPDELPGRANQERDDLRKMQ